METHFVKIEFDNKITPDVLRIVTGKPAWFNLKSGRAIEMVIN